MIEFMKPDRQSAARDWLLLAAAVATAAALFALGGCATSQIDQARSILATSMEAQVGIVHVFEQADKAHQDAIVAEAVAAHHPEAAEPALKAYRAKRAYAEEAIDKSAAVMLVGVSLIPLVEAGSRSTVDLQKWLLDMLTAAIGVKTALDQLGFINTPKPAEVPASPPHVPQPQSGVPRSFTFPEGFKVITNSNTCCDIAQPPYCVECPHA